MAYRSILVHADLAPHAPERMALALQLALRCGAHLTAAACSGLSRHAEADTPWRQLPQVRQQLAAWREQAQAALQAFAVAAVQAGLARYDSLLLDDEPEAGLLQLAPYHDVLVLSPRGVDRDPPGATHDLQATLLLHGGRPLLLTPPGAPSALRRPLLAWDGGGAAARAISSAIPLLKLADSVTLLVLNDSPAHGAEPGADMALFLARHGVPVTLLHEYTRAPIGAALLDVAAAQGCDLLVMGGYGHRRWRELLLGGTTRTVLHDMNLPVWLAH